MHMADALISPAVGGSMWAVSSGLLLHSGRKLRVGLDERQVPLMGVLGAFVFAAQMINFTIPMTGSSGHLGGGMILAILLGPQAAFLTMASVLTVQALFFADGGLLALGCNVFNLGFFPCFVAYPLIYRTIAGLEPSPRRILLGSLAASILALQMGAMGVVLETTLSGISELPIGAFSLVMLPIHLGVGLVEGLVTAGVVTFVWKARPEVLAGVAEPGASALPPVRSLILGLLAVTAVTGGLLSWFASSHPDGLEWAVSHTSGRGELPTPQGGPFEFFGRLQEGSAILPDYGFKAEETGTDSGARSRAGRADGAGTSQGNLGTGVVAGDPADPGGMDEEAARRNPARPGGRDEETAGRLAATAEPRGQTTAGTQPAGRTAHGKAPERGTADLEGPDTGTAHGEAQEQGAATLEGPDSVTAHAETASEAAPAGPEPWPAVSAGTSLSGIVGAGITLVLVGLIGLLLRRYHQKARSG